MRFVILFLISMFSATMAIANCADQGITVTPDQPFSALLDRQSRALAQGTQASYIIDAYRKYPEISEARRRFQMDQIFEQLAGTAGLGDAIAQLRVGNADPLRLMVQEQDSTPANDQLLAYLYWTHGCFTEAAAILRQTDPATYQRNRALGLVHLAMGDLESYADFVGVIHDPNEAGPTLSVWVLLQYIQQNQNIIEILNEAEAIYLAGPQDKISVLPFYGLAYVIAGRLGNQAAQEQMIALSQAEERRLKALPTEDLLIDAYSERSIFFAQAGLCDLAAQTINGVLSNNRPVFHQFALRAVTAYAMCRAQGYDFGNG